MLSSETRLVVEVERTRTMTTTFRCRSMTGEADVDDDEVDDDDVKDQEKCFVYFGDVVKNKSSENENDKIL